MTTETEGRFPPGEVGKRFNVLGGIEKGQFVYIRAEFRTIGETGCAWVRVRDPKDYSFNNIAVPVSQLVCREPAAMEADNGIVRGIE